MRRAVTTLTLLAVVAATVVVAWLWWTAPPSDEAEHLAAVSAGVPADADGVLIIARPARAARWLGSHPQALALLKVVAPHVDRRLPKMRALLAGLAGQTTGPLAIWWSGPELSIAGRVGGASARALERLAALEGSALRARNDGWVAVASDPSLLDAAAGAPVPRLEPGKLSALARIGPRWWLVRAGRSRLELLSGRPPALPDPTGPAIVSTTDLSALAAAAEPPEWVPHAPAIVVAEEGGWALALPDTTLAREVQRVLAIGGDVPAEAPEGARHWRGLLGDLWVMPGAGVAIASRPELLARLPRRGLTEDSGLVRGPDLARVCARLAKAADGIPGGAALARALSRTAPVLAAVRTARWHLTPKGGSILLEW
jgi:hypothetical protein